MTCESPRNHNSADLTLNQRVQGSSPCAPTNKIKDLASLFPGYRSTQNTSCTRLCTQWRGRPTASRANSAGISTTQDVNGQVALEVFDTNAIGIIRVTQAALPLLERSENPVVVNVSSALGSFWAVTNPERRQFHFPSIIYGSSKAAVSMLTVQYAKALPEIKFNAVEPGFTATELTPFGGAGQPAEKGAEVIVRMAHVGRDGPTGTFQKGDGELRW